MHHLQHHHFSAVRLECVSMHLIYIHPQSPSPSQTKPQQEPSKNRKPRNSRKMSSRNKPSAGAKDGKSNTCKPEMRVTEVEEAGGIIMMGHYEDAQLKSNNHDSNSAISSEQANTSTRTANNASIQVATITTNLNADPPKAFGPHLCSNCSTPGHRYPECPHRPCKHCNVMGHVGKNCPEIVEDRVQRRRASWRRYHAPRNDMEKTG